MMRTGQRADRSAVCRYRPARAIAGAPSILLALCCLVLASGLAQAQPTASAAKHDEQARAYFRTELFERAADEFRKAYEIDKKPARLFNIGLAYEKAGAKDKARDAYEEYLQVEADGDRAVEARARKEALDQELAVEAERRAAAEAKAAADAAALELAGEADALVESEQHEEAATKYQAAFETNDDSTYLFKRAEALRRAGKRENAIEAYRTYRANAPDGLYQGEARRRQEELEAAQLAGPSDEATAAPAIVTARKATNAGPEPVSGAGLQLTSYISAGVSLAALGTSLYAGREFRRRRDEQAGMPSSEETDTVGSFDVLHKTSLSVSMQGAGAAALCYYLGRGDRRDSNLSTVSSCLLGGWGVGALVFAGYIGLKSAQIESELNQADWDNQEWTDEYQRLFDRGNAYATIGRIHLIGGLGGLAAGTLLYVLGDKGMGSEREGLTVVPSYGDGQLGLVGTLRF